MPDSSCLPESIVFTAEQAQALHNSLCQGAVVIWTVTANPSDRPGMFVARPHAIPMRATLIPSLSMPDNESVQVRLECLEAATLDDLRKARPNGTFILGRATNDDPVIVETWIG